MLISSTSSSYFFPLLPASSLRQRLETLCFIGWGDISLCRIIFLFSFFQSRAPSAAGVGGSLVGLWAGLRTTDTPDLSLNVTADISTQAAPPDWWTLSLPPCSAGLIRSRSKVVFIYSYLLSSVVAPLPPPITPLALASGLMTYHARSVGRAVYL